MTTDELSSCGYCCTGRALMARQPISTITRLTTIARTGWRMKTSVIERMRCLRPARSAGGQLGRGLGRRCCGSGRDQRGIAQLEGAGRGDLLTGLEAGFDQHFAPEERARLDLAQ